MEGLLERLGSLEDRHRELSLRVIDPEVISDATAYKAAMRDYKQLDPIVDRIRRYRSAQDGLVAAREDLGSDDAELREMAQEEVERLSAESTELERELQEALVPQDPFFFFHHCGLDRLRRQWQARNERVRPMAYGYPAASTGYTEAFGTPVGLYDCLGCTAHEAVSRTQPL